MEYSRLFTLTGAHIFTRWFTPRSLSLCVFLLSVTPRGSASPRLYLSFAEQPPRIMRETHAPDAVSLKTAHSGVKFEILISKKPIQFRPARNQPPTNQPTNRPTNPSSLPIPLSPLPTSSLFLALFLSRPRSHPVLSRPTRRGDESRLLKSLERFN